MPRTKVLGENQAHISAMMPRKLYEAMRKRLSREQKTYSQWMREQAATYLDSGGKH